MKIFLILLLFKIIVADYISNLPCIERPVQEYFDLEKITGRWYVISKYESTYEQTTDCNYGDYESIDKLSMKSFDCELVNGTYHCLKGIFKTEISDQFPMGFKHSYVLLNDQTKPVNDDFKFLSTDFTNYLTLYDSKNIDNGKSMNLFWLLSRKTTIDDSVKDKVNNLIDQYFDRKGLMFINQNSELCDPRV